MLAFVALAPWLWALDTRRSLPEALLCGYAMSLAYTVAAFAWFGSAIGSYTQLGTAVGLSALLVAAPLFQPQFLAVALVRHLVGRHHHPATRALAGAATWVAVESLVPRLLGDSFGYGLHPSRVLRQAADVGGAAGLAFLLLLANEGVAAAVSRGKNGLRAAIPPLALAALVPIVLAVYGLVALSQQPAAASPGLRVGLLQSNIVDYERLSRERGAGAVVREVLDVHFAMSWDAVERQRVDAVLWSETVYPTTFGHPKSAAGADLDSEILQTIDAAGVPFVFGTYDRDTAGEYNAAAFVAPGQGLIGFYRKTRPFPLTEYVPAWLDGPTLRRWLPWAGTWKPGTGARVFPLRLRDGREVPVLPLICLDDMDAGLAIDGARLGAQAILAISNDAWFSDHPNGARLHLVAAAFRSIETRLPQFRATTNGYTAAIDATGTVVAAASMGERMLVVASLPVRDAPRTLMTAWGDWVGRTAAMFLALLAIAVVVRRWAAAAPRPPSAVSSSLGCDVVVLPGTARVAAGLLRTFARVSLLGMLAGIAFGESALQANILAEVRTFATLVVAPEAAAWCVMRAFGARASIAMGHLLLVRGRQRLELPVREIAAVEPWRIPVPGPGASLRLTHGGHWHRGIALADPWALARAVEAAGGAPQDRRSSRGSQYLQARIATAGGRLQHLGTKFLLLPLALAVPAFRLHQHIAYGSSFGEYQAFGAIAFVKGFALSWATWIMAVTLCAAVLRMAIETATLAMLFLRPAATMAARRYLELLGLATLYLGLPAWLLIRIVAM